MRALGPTGYARDTYRGIGTAANESDCIRMRASGRVQQDYHFGKVRARASQICTCFRNGAHSGQIKCYLTIPTGLSAGARKLYTMYRGTHFDWHACVWSRLFITHIVSTRNNNVHYAHTFYRNHVQPLAHSLSVATNCRTFVWKILH